MKRITSVSLVFLVLSLSTNAAAPDSKQAKTVPRDVYGLMDGALSFVPMGEDPMDVIALGDCEGTLTHLGGIEDLHQAPACARRNRSQER